MRMNRRQRRQQARDLRASTWSTITTIPPLSIDVLRQAFQRFNNCALCGLRIGLHERAFHILDTGLMRHDRCTVLE